MLTARRWKLALGLAPVALLAPIGLHALGPVDFHQFLIERLLVRSRFSLGHATNGLLAAFDSGVSIALRRPSSQVPPLEDARRVFDFVFSWLPPVATVYPTEGFYYFSFRTEGETGAELVRGNLRVADFEQGTATFAYFRTSDKEVWGLHLGPEDRFLVEPAGKGEYDVTYACRTVRFHLALCSQEPPATRLASGERFLGEVFDESGVRFSLLFNDETDSFYYVLNDVDGMVEELRAYSEELLVGSRTGFVFYDDPELARKLLVGVDLDRIRKNDLFDGPGDQVPFDLFVRNEVHRAYPHTLLGSGINEHGVFQGRDRWLRVAICPYRRYASLEEVQARVYECLAAAGPGLSTRLTKEWWNDERWRERTQVRLAEEGKEMPGGRARG